MIALLGMPCRGFWSIDVVCYVGALNQPLTNPTMAASFVLSFGGKRMFRNAPTNAASTIRRNRKDRKTPCIYVFFTFSLPFLHFVLLPPRCDSILPCQGQCSTQRFPSWRARCGCNCRYSTAVAVTCSDHPSRCQFGAAIQLRRATSDFEWQVLTSKTPDGFWWPCGISNGRDLLFESGVNCLVARVLCSFVDLEVHSSFLTSCWTSDLDLNRPRILKLFGYVIQNNRGKF